jgi:hypothetical protein
MFRDLSTLMNSPLRIKALAYILKRPDEAGTVPEFASIAGTTKENAQKELQALVRLGMVRSRGAGSDKTFVPDTEDLLYEPLQKLLVDSTTPDAKEIVDAFKGTRGLWLIVAAGVLANEPRSAVDLLIVTRNPEEPGIGKAIKKIESLSAVPIRYAVLEVEEYMGRRQAYDRLLRDIFEYAHEVVLERGSGAENPVRAL